MEAKQLHNLRTGLGTAGTSLTVDARGHIGWGTRLPCFTRTIWVLDVFFHSREKLSCDSKMSQF